jgi:ATP adenylyltransferase
LVRRNKGVCRFLSAATPSLIAAERIALSASLRYTVFSVTYEQLVDFLQNRMRMSHLYQPVMLMTLLQQGGRCSTPEIARSILAHDQSQVEYYENVTKNMVGRVLRNHGILEKEGGSYSLVGYEDLGGEQVEHLIELCRHKLNEYKAKRGKRIWQHRKASAGYIPGTLRYEVLKQARFRCELCGVSADVRALEVDHIVPRNRSGTDDPDNLQALCYRCNTMKRDREDTDFRGVGESYERRKQGCPFCEVPNDQMVGETELAYAIRDTFPVAPLHTLVIPKRHVQGYFELGRPEFYACHRLLEREKKAIEQADPGVEGFNVGVNDREVAGQTIFHCHLHLIPRRKGDVEDPTGGVRHVIPGKGDYRR